MLKLILGLASLFRLHLLLDLRVLVLGFPVVRVEVGSSLALASGSWLLLFDTITLRPVPYRLSLRVSAHRVHLGRKFVLARVRHLVTHFVQTGHIALLS